jgi:hypothetical protein
MVGASGQKEEKQNIPLVLMDAIEASARSKQNGNRFEEMLL